MNGRFTSSRRCDHWYLVTGCSFSLAAAVVQLFTLPQSSPSPSRPEYVPPLSVTCSNHLSSVSYRTLVRSQATAHIEVKSRPHRTIYTYREGL